MTVFELMMLLSEFPGNMEVRGTWEGITVPVKHVYRSTDKDHMNNPRDIEVVLIDVDQ